MSKYIRTKDGIYKIDETFKRDNQIAFFDNKKQTHGYIIGFFEGKNVLKQADTIEELVDGYYVDVNDQSFTLSECYDNFEDAKKNYKDWISYSDRKYLEYTVILYAFIKTNKGLIYVAKMNDKGELELL